MVMEGEATDVAARVEHSVATPGTYTQRWIWKTLSGTCKTLLTFRDVAREGTQARHMNSSDPIGVWPSKIARRRGGQSRAKGKGRDGRGGSSQQYRRAMQLCGGGAAGWRGQIYERFLAAPQCFRQCGDIARHSIRAPHIFPAAHLREMTTWADEQCGPAVKSILTARYPLPHLAQESGEEWPRGCRRRCSTRNGQARVIGQGGHPTGKAGSDQPDHTTAEERPLWARHRCPLRATHRV